MPALEGRLHFGEYEIANEFDSDSVNTKIHQLFSHLYIANNFIHAVCDGIWLLFVYL
ncbi:hypothetical protein ED5_2635 [Enterobacter roggenkampii]|nr:hypothetical protein ED5_2635 [Enterobacter roggenkampii]